MSLPRFATVFGGTGFLGHAVVQKLAQEGYCVRVPTRDPDKARDLKLMGQTGQIWLARTSLKTDAALASLMAGSEIVINLIGILAENQSQTFQSAHVEMAARLARLARAEKVRHFVHVSALGASMDSPSRYARTKAVGEEAVRAFFPDAVILRPSVLFGRRDRFLNRLIQLARFSPIIPLIGGGQTRFQPVYVGDVAQAVWAGCRQASAKGRTFACTGPDIYTLKELTQKILARTGRKRLLLPIPWGVARFLAVFLERMPSPPLTRDQLVLLQTDNVLGARSTGLQSKTRGFGTLGDLGLTPRSLDAV